MRRSMCRTPSATARNGSDCRRGGNTTTIRWLGASRFATRTAGHRSLSPETTIAVSYLWFAACVYLWITRASYVDNTSSASTMVYA